MGADYRRLRRRQFNSEPSKCEHSNGDGGGYVCIDLSYNSPHADYPVNAECNGKGAKQCALFTIPEGSLPPSLP